MAKRRIGIWNAFIILEILKLNNLSVLLTLSFIPILSPVRRTFLKIVLLLLFLERTGKE